MNEFWAKIPISGDLYEVSTDGRVRRSISCRGTRRGRILQGCKCQGYHRVGLIIDGKEKKFYIHRLIALTFLGACPHGMRLRHRNGRKCDNRLSNLGFVHVKKVKKIGFFS